MAQTDYCPVRIIGVYDDRQNSDSNSRNSGDHWDYSGEHAMIAKLVEDVVFLCCILLFIVMVASVSYIVYDILRDIFRKW